MRISCSLATILIVAVAALRATAADYAEIDRIVTAEMRSTTTPGAAIAIIDGEKVVFAKGFGLANVETNEPVKPEMLFRLGSTTKMFTAAALATLAEEGKLKLDEPIGRSIPGLHPRIAALTAHQLLSHTAGLTDESIMSGRHDDAALGDGIRTMDEKWFFTEPGQIYSYANPGFWIAGLACETLDGKPYADVMQARLFRPLKMERTTLRPTEAMTWPLALGHEVKQGEPRVVRPQADNAATWPAGQIYSNVHDLSRFVIALMHGGQLNGEQLLVPAVVARLGTPYVQTPGTKDHYGYGLTVGEERGVRVLSHGGSRLGYGSTIRMAPDHKVAVIVLTNRSGSSLPRTAQRALEIALGLPAGPVTKLPEPQPPSEREIAELAGVYTNHRQTITLSMREGKLYGRRSGGGFSGWSGPVVKTGESRIAVSAPGNEETPGQPLVSLTVVRNAAGKPEYLCAGSRALKKQDSVATATDKADAAAPLAGYRRPPKPVTDILDAPPTPFVSLSPTRDNLLLIERASYPPIADLAAPMLGLAGVRINPRTNGPHLAPRITGLVLQSLAGGEQRRIELPAGANVGSPLWSPDGRQLAFTRTTDSGIELWVAGVTDAKSRQIPGVTISDVVGDAMQWMPDSRSLLVQTIPISRGVPPAPPAVPPGPTIQESTGRSGPVRTYQDLLQNAHDEALFDHYATSQPALVDAAGQQVTRVGPAGIYSRLDPSPDGQHVLAVRIERPYSYVLPLPRFPKQAEVWSRQGQVERKLALLPLEDRVPIDGVPTGPRSYHWRPTQAATLVWTEALDEGDPRKEVAHRDRLLSLAAPFTAEPAELAKTEQRFSGITWGAKDGLALLRDYDRNRRWTRTFLISADRPGQQPELIWERSVNDHYGDPGTPLLKPLPDGGRVLWQQGDSLFLDGAGATPKGDRPFLDRFDLKSRKTERLFQCDEASYESVVALVSDDGSRFITRRESPADPPNYVLRIAGGRERKLTNFADPMPQLRGIQKQLVTYQRADGVPLSFTLYLPPDHKPGQRLPTVVWAYPREYNDPQTAGQVAGSTNRFTTIGGMSQLFFLTQGYAVLDGATMPVVGDPATANDTYIEQIVASAKAAIDKAAEMGVTDPRRVGVGGHSYGAFMTANLLAHSDLFRAGIARSGAYNRTLTPFGFQSERRTLWEAPEIYLRMSPFMAAEKINEPILLIHGEADDNPGTFPVQSERLYQAIRGNGGTIRYVTLPHEAHGYAARESLEHTLFEMISWFDQHVKNAPASENP